MSTAEQFAGSLSTLMPQGYAWPRAPYSVQMRVISAFGHVLDDALQVIHSTAQQWLPHRTATRLAEWEEACSLPDPCMGTAQTPALRLKALLRRLRGPGLPYENSSACAPGVIKQICADVGYEVEVRYNTPFRVGRDRVSRRVGVLDGRMNVIVQNAGDRFRVGVNRVGDRLIKRLETPVDLECYLLRILPARFEIVFTYL